MGREVGQLYGAARAVLDPLFDFLWRIEVEGVDHLPEHGGAILAPNHLSVLDHFVLASSLPRRITFVGKAEYMDDWKTKYIFPALGMIPIDRGGGSAANRALDAAARVLGDGELFGIYPEGTRSRDGKLHKGHTGVARLAMRTGCPIIPAVDSPLRRPSPQQAGAARDHRRADVRDPRALGPGVRGHVRDEAGRGHPDRDGAHPRRGRGLIRVAGAV